VVLQHSWWLGRHASLDCIFIERASHPRFSALASSASPLPPAFSYGGHASPSAVLCAPQPHKPGTAPGGLAAKLGAAGEAGAAGTADYPHLLERVLASVLSEEWADAIGELQRDQFGSPLLQALLRAAACLGNG
jgi:hypothetical protein